ncbi:MAG: 16S rRNA processing protein RimM [Coriobacteriia bacterium]|nr:16S rRNA processing protein RimM [Coriobacteriia bacterium]
MDASPFTAVARILKTHGLDGEVSAALLVRHLEPAALQAADVWPVPPKGVPRPLHVSETRGCDETSCILAFEEVTDVATAKCLVGTLLLMRADDLPETLESAVDDVVGFEVVDATRGSLGSIVDVIVTGANDVWVVHGPFDEVLVPVIDDVVVSVDHAQRTARVSLLPGLIDED